MGRVRQQPEGEILRSDAGRQKEAGPGLKGMAADDRDPRSLPRGGEGNVMRALRAWLFRMWGLFRRSKAEQDFSAQIEADIEFQIEDGIHAGMSREEARRFALLKFGGIDAAKE